MSSFAEIVPSNAFTFINWFSLRASVSMTGQKFNAAITLMLALEIYSDKMCLDHLVFKWAFKLWSVCVIVMHTAHRRVSLRYNVRSWVGSVWCALVWCCQLFCYGLRRVKMIDRWHSIEFSYSSELVTVLHFYCIDLNRFEIYIFYDMWKTQFIVRSWHFHQHTHILMHNEQRTRHTWSDMRH